MMIKKIFAHKSRIINLSLLFIGLLSLWYWRMDINKFVALIGDRDAIVVYLEQFHGWGPMILALILASQVFLAFIPGARVYSGRRLCIWSFSWRIDHARQHRSRQPTSIHVGSQGWASICQSDGSNKSD